MLLRKTNHREAGKENDQLRSECQKLEHYNQCWANKCRREKTVIDRQKNSLKNEKIKTSATEK